MSNQPAKPQDADADKTIAIAAQYIDTAQIYAKPFFERLLQLAKRQQQQLAALRNEAQDFTI